ncbi:MAG: ArsR/SmtB family transcription factor [Acidimicrobiia bacterium]
MSEHSAGRGRSQLSGDLRDVEAVEPRILDPDDALELAQRFQLLADAGRLRMVYALLEAGEMCVGDLAALVGASESATSHQLRQLRLAGLVRARRQGREMFYRVADTHVRLLLDVAVEHYLHGHEDRS